MSKVKAAIDYIKSIRLADPVELSNTVEELAGTELGEFFTAYSRRALLKSPADTEVLMLMGYLIRCNEEKENKVLQWYDGKIALA